MSAASSVQAATFIGPSRPASPAHLIASMPPSSAQVAPQTRRGSRCFGGIEANAHLLSLPRTRQGAALQRQQALEAAAAATAATASTSAPSATPRKKLTCDKCDGPHLTDMCPHFKKRREEHKDAWVNYGNKRLKQMGSNGGNFVLKTAKILRQPGDGSCLFHSLCYGLKDTHPTRLRQQLADFIARNPRVEISGDTLEEWVRWDANTSCQAYAKRMAVGGWGGGVEMAVCAFIKMVNVHVYERLRNGTFKRISCFDHPKPRQTVHVLYQGGVHYDALIPI